MKIPPAPKLTKIGKTKPVCPYCNTNLPKMYARKTNCPECGESIYKRTRPLDGKHILVRENQLLTVERQEWVKKGIYEQQMSFRLEEEQKHESMRLKLQKKWGNEPSEYDVLWNIYNQDCIQQARNGDWGFYRNTRFQMAELRMKEKEYNHALFFLCEVLYIDLHGPSNMGGRKPDRYFKPFDPKFSFVAPGVLTRVLRAAKLGKISPEKIEEVFSEAVRIGQGYIVKPLTNKMAWKRIREKLFEDEK